MIPRKKVVEAARLARPGLAVVRVPAARSGSGGSDATSFCATLCESCGGGASAQCASECEAGFAEAGTGIDFDSRLSEQSALGSCLGANNCDNDACGPQFIAYIICLVGIPF